MGNEALAKLEILLREMIDPRRFHGDYRIQDLRRVGDTLLVTVMIDGQPHDVRISAPTPSPP